MKTCSVILLYLLQFNITNAQAPDYFADDPEWFQTTTCNWNNCIEYNNFVYYIDGDSTVNNVVYHKIYQRGEVTAYPLSQGQTCGAAYTYVEFKTLLRQDSLEVYQYENGGPEELLYSFDLNVGDTLPQTANLWSTTTVVDSIEMLTINGTSRKKFYVSSADIFASFMIEGIGANTGLLERMDAIFECGHNLNCYRVNGQIELGGSCFFDVSVSEIDVQNDLEVFPNPASDVITITTASNHAIRSVRVVQMNGDISQEINFNQQEQETEIPIEFLENGMYLLQINLINGQQVNKKILKL